MFDFIGNFISSLIRAPFICLGWLIVGVLAGAFARQIVGGRSAGACNDFILGIAGAIVGGMLAGLLDIGGPEGGLGRVIVSLIVSTGGAVVLILVFRVIRGRSR
jgi:uncharacterized membrane protein YeaQ/YmgE (transglycosylase-associated protein family)